MLRLIRDVLAFKPQARGTSIATALEYTLHALTKRSVLFLVSDFEDAGYQKPLRVAARKHDLIAVNCSIPANARFRRRGCCPCGIPKRGGFTGETPLPVPGGRLFRRKRCAARLKGRYFSNLPVWIVLNCRWTSPI